MVFVERFCFTTRELGYSCRHFGIVAKDVVKVPSY